jgi:hypothetical protein
MALDLLRFFLGSAWVVVSAFSGIDAFPASIGMAESFLTAAPTAGAESSAEVPKVTWLAFVDRRILVLAGSSSA